MPVGGELVGLGAASWEYFGLPVDQLSTAQGAYIAALINAPSTLDPYANYEGLTARQQLVLNRMHEFGFIDEAELASAKTEDVVFQPRNYVLKYPYFSFYVRNLLEREFGQEVVSEGLRVTTSLDPILQEQAMALLSAQVEENSEKWQASNG